MQRKIFPVKEAIQRISYPLGEYYKYRGRSAKKCLLGRYFADTANERHEEGQGREKERGEGKGEEDRIDWEWRRNINKRRGEILENCRDKWEKNSRWKLIDWGGWIVKQQQVILKSIRVYWKWLWLRKRGRVYAVQFKPQPKLMEMRLYGVGMKGVPMKTPPYSKNKMVLNSMIRVKDCREIYVPVLLSFHFAILGHCVWPDQVSRILWIVFCAYLRCCKKIYKKAQGQHCRKRLAHLRMPGSSSVSGSEQQCFFYTKSKPFSLFYAEQLWFEVFSCCAKYSPTGCAQLHILLSSLGDVSMHFFWSRVFLRVFFMCRHIPASLWPGHPPYIPWYAERNSMKLYTTSAGTHFCIQCDT